MANIINIGRGVNIIGILARAFNLQNVRVPDVRQNPYPDQQLGYTPDETRPAKMLGMGNIPVFVDLKLQGGQYTQPYTNKIITFPTITFEAVIMTVEKVTRIVKTEIQGRDGTVKEYIGKDDSKITIQGVITGQNGVYPQTEVNALNQWYDAPISKQIICPWAQNIGITDIVCEDLTFAQVTGGYSYQQFTMNCISDLPVNLYIQ